jgi:hypothetical protein
MWSGWHKSGRHTSVAAAVMKQTAKIINVAKSKEKFLFS